MEQVFEVKSNFTTSILNSCKSVFNLIKEGKEKEAKKSFPLEYYLVKKYLYNSLSDLSNLINNRIQVS